MAWELKGMGVMEVRWLWRVSWLVKGWRDWWLARGLEVEGVLEQAYKPFITEAEGSPTLRVM